MNRINKLKTMHPTLVKDSPMAIATLLYAIIFLSNVL